MTIFRAVLGFVTLRAVCMMGAVDRDFQENASLGRILARGMTVLTRSNFEDIQSHHSHLAASINGASYHKRAMGFPIKICSVCGEEFELKPDKPGFANRCPECSEEKKSAPPDHRQMDADERKSLKEANEARRRAMRDLLYRKDS